MDPVDDRVREIQRNLDTLRAEVDVKMKIMEQILNTRNEQFVIQKKLIEREHALYESVLSHWKNSGDVAASGHSTRYSNTLQDFQIIESSRQDSSEFPSTSAKRSCTTAFSERSRLRAKRLRSSLADASAIQKTEDLQDDEPIPPVAEVQWDHEDGASDNDPVGINEDPQFSEVEGNSGAESDDGEDGEDGVADSGMQKRVFVNFYSAEPSNPDEESNDPIWLHFLHEQNGAAALCKHCDKQGVQKIYKLLNPSLSVLRTHLKRKHRIVVEAPPPPSPATFIAERERTSTLFNTLGFRKFYILRHNDYLYQRYFVRNSSEYWRCREFETCSGRLVMRNGVIQETSEHCCLTTPADCDAAEIRKNIREMAQNNPELSSAEIIAAAKRGFPQNVLELVPNDSSLRGTIRRIRHAMESGQAPTEAD